jgi:hypothetical protein
MTAIKFNVRYRDFYRRCLEYLSAEARSLSVLEIPRIWDIHYTESNKMQMYEHMYVKPKWVCIYNQLAI